MMGVCEAGGGISRYGMDVKESIQTDAHRPFLLMKCFVFLRLKEKAAK
jgi:hypothetical protein